MTPGEIKAMREKLGLSTAEFGRALGLTKDNASRVVRSWEEGEIRKGRPSVPSATAIMAMKYLAAICDVFGKDYTHAHHEIEESFRQVLPPFMTAHLPFRRRGV